MLSSPLNRAPFKFFRLAIKVFFSCDPVWVVVRPLRTGFVLNVYCHVGVSSSIRMSLNLPSFVTGIAFFHFWKLIREPPLFSLAKLPWRLGHSLAG